jgi:hypothetical protein
MPNFVFPLLCVSSADVDFWVNGGWDQPNCGITVDPEFFLLLLLNQNFQGKICEHSSIWVSIILFDILKEISIKTKFDITSLCREVSKELKLCIS